MAFLAVPGAWRAALDLTMIGAFAGFYVVPLFAFVQSRAPRERLSRVIAGNNIVNALLICIASGFGIGLTALGLSVPTIFLVTLLQIIASFKVFGQIRLITGGGPASSTKPLIQYIYEQAFDKNKLGYAAAMSYILFIILVVCTLVQMRFQRGGDD
jgi:hypothetical protein